MIRFILCRNTKATSGAATARFYTLLLDVPELEAAMTHGGFGEDAHDFSELVGAEIVLTETEVKPYEDL